ncbi:MAG: SGNH/GDSL hydrolase family protein [Candidatus Eremiobacteraeota bacterium]|nr:SGNH/GDSL hydrolase family protein [Candidatus Eremiobacteraeota bacterium]
MSGAGSLQNQADRQEKKPPDNRGPEKKKGSWISIAYRLFVVVFLFVSSLYILWYLSSIPSFLSKSNVGERLGMMYAIQLKSPPLGSEIITLMGVLLLIGVYLVIDLFFLQKVSFKAKILFNLIWIIMLFGTVELFLTRYVRLNPDLYRPHPTLIWELTPNFFADRKDFHDPNNASGREYPDFPANKGRAGAIQNRINRFGMRYPDFPVKKEPGEFRFIILGDSSAFGLGVPEWCRYTDILEEKLQEAYPHRKIRIINAAVPGYTTFQMNSQMKLHMKKFKPDCLILATINDHATDYAGDKKRGPSEILMPLFNLLYRSKIYMVLRKNIFNWSFNRKLRDHKKTATKPRPTSHRVNINDSKKFQEEMINRIKSWGGSAIIISQPVRDSFLEGDTARKYRNVMREVCQSTGSLFVDINSQWTRQYSEGLFYDCVHPNREGHRKEAEILYEMIISNDVIPKNKR